MIRIFLPLIILPLTCFAQLKWESQELTLKPTPLDSSVVGHFKFKNAGKYQIKIKSVTSSCGCTTVALEKRSFEPAETGEIVATFNIGERVGLQEKTILVESSDPEAPKTVLLLKVLIPEIAEVKPTFLYWPSNEPIKEKEIAVKILENIPVKTLTVSSSDPNVVTRVEAIKAGKEYQIVVKPKEGTKAVNAMLSIDLDYPPEKPKRFFAKIRMK